MASSNLWSVRIWMPDASDSSKPAAETEVETHEGEKEQNKVKNFALVFTSDIAAKSLQVYGREQYEQWIGNIDAHTDDHRPILIELTSFDPDGKCNVDTMSVETCDEVIRTNKELVDAKERDPRKTKMLHKESYPNGKTVTTGSTSGQKVINPLDKFLKKPATAPVETK